MLHLRVRGLKRVLLCFTATLFPVLLWADEVQIVSADFQQGRNGLWSLNVGLLHADSGWNHYADIWRLVDLDGNVLGERVLLHPHEDEQPFVRGASGIEIPDGISMVYIEAHDLVHGWTPNHLEVDLSQAENGRLRLLPNP